MPAGSGTDNDVFQSWNQQNPNLLIVSLCHPSNVLARANPRLQVGAMSVVANGKYSLYSVVWFAWVGVVRERVTSHRTITNFFVIGIKRVGVTPLVRFGYSV